MVDEDMKIWRQDMILTTTVGEKGREPNHQEMASGFTR